MSLVIPSEHITSDGSIALFIAITDTKRLPKNVAFISSELSGNFASKNEVFVAFFLKSSSDDKHLSARLSSYSFMSLSWSRNPYQ